MRILDLTNKVNSDIKYEVYPFPDGQQQIKLDVNFNNKVWLGKDVLIQSRLNSFKDLELISCARASFKNMDIEDIKLYIPYVLGSRSDRQFEIGSCNYLKQVFCPIINSLKFKKVIVLDPHSDVLEGCLDNFSKINNTELAKWSLENIYHTSNPNMILMSPDAGAVKKIEALAKDLDYKGDIINCSKSRDLSGKITKTIVPYFDLSKDIILIDDILDGGKTFIEIGKIIKERQESYERQTPSDKRRTGKLYLIVTHGIFSKGYKELNKYFDGMFCTNSYKEIPELEWDGDKHDFKTNVKCLNIF